MKDFTLIVLLFGLSFYSCHQVNSNDELRMTVEKVKARLVSGEPLPDSISNIDSLTSGKPDPLQHDFTYHAIRKENNVVDSVSVLLTIENDSLLHFTITEQYFANGMMGKSYLYAVNKYGVIDYAYQQETSKDSISPPVKNSDGTISFRMTPAPVFGIDFYSEDSTLRTPDKATIEMYNERLKTVVNELKDILFNN